MSGPAELIPVPDLVGLEVRQAREVADALDLFVTGGNPDGPPLGALTWAGRWVVTGQRPPAGTLVARAAWIVVDFDQRGGGEAGDREPRVPEPPSGTMRTQRAPFEGDVRSRPVSTTSDAGQ